VEHAEIRMANSDAIRVEGALREVEQKLSDAARSGSSRLAWLTEEDSGQRVGVNPDQVVSLRPSGDQA
jgi:hypothetical protein